MSVGDSIEADDALLRRFFPTIIRKDGTLSSAAFMIRSTTPDPNCSIYVERLTTQQRVLDVARPHKMRLARLLAAVPMEMGLGVVRDPLSDELGSAEHAHSVIQGLSTKAQCSALAEKCEIVPNKEP